MGFLEGFASAGTTRTVAGWDAGFAAGLGAGFVAIGGVVLSLAAGLAGAGCAFLTGALVAGFEAGRERDARSAT